MWLDGRRHIGGRLVLIGVGGYGCCMQHNQNSGVAGGMESTPPSRELLSRRVTGSITAITVILQTLLFVAVMAEGYFFAPSVSEFVGSVFLFSSILCLLWGSLIYRTCRKWAWLCIIESLVTFLLLTLRVSIH